MSFQPAGINAAGRTPYPPSTGDLVFFQYQADHVASTMVSILDWPHYGDLAVSHIGIIDVRPDGVHVIENGLHKPNSVREPLLEALCYPVDSAPRFMLTIPQPDPAKATDVLSEATMMIAASDYSKMQLGLAGLAAILRRMPCTWIRRQVWEIVHEFSRAIERDADTLRHMGSKGYKHYFAGTCVGMVAEAQWRAGAELQVVEPDCADPEDAKSMGYYISLLADGVANVVLNRLGDLDDGAARVRDSIGATPSLESPDSVDTQVIPSDALDPADPTLIAPPGERVFFGPRAAVDLVKELLRLEMVILGTEHKLLRDFHTTFAIFDAMVYAIRGTDAPQPGELVYRPLMSLGLILDQLGQPGGPYFPYPHPRP
jgi:hypothetical protein